MGRGKHCSLEKQRDIRNLRANGHTYKEICALLNCSQSSITNAMNKKTTVETRGRRRATTAKIDRLIVRLSKSNPTWSAVDIKRELGLSVCVHTVRKRLMENNLYGRVSRKVPMLTKKNIRNRILFAKKHLHWPPEKWRNILWTDETKINLCGTDGKLRPTSQKHGVESEIHKKDGKIWWRKHHGLGMFFLEWCRSNTPHPKQQH